MLFVAISQQRQAPNGAWVSGRYCGERPMLSHFRVFSIPLALRVLVFSFHCSLRTKNDGPKAPFFTGTHIKVLWLLCIVFCIAFDESDEPEPKKASACIDYLMLELHLLHFVASQQKHVEQCGWLGGIALAGQMRLNSSSFASAARPRGYSCGVPNNGVVWCCSLSGTPMAM